MKPPHRKYVLSRMRTAALLAVGAVILGGAAACGSAAAPAGTGGSRASARDATTATRRRPVGRRDQLVSVRGARMHLRCEGSGATTVVLIAGLTDGGDGWGPLRASMIARTRVCDYARFGTGTSDPAPTDQTFSTEAADLRTLLRVAGEPGPYVLVGHSFGGPEAVTFAHRYADDVAGLMLIDASPAGWYDAVCSVPDDGSAQPNTFGELCASLSNPAANPERLDAPPSFAAVANITSLGDLPMVVLSGSERSFAGVSASELGQLTRLWNAGQAAWARLSTASQLVPVEHVGHYIHLELPELVIELLRRLLP
ncbi:MAG: alpha/beta hydrolase [Acidimicrobiia bacterium]|nr:alpha/beta hydrolase [Acidimicrobiia bacterium]